MASGPPLSRQVHAVQKLDLHKLFRDEYIPFKQPQLIRCLKGSFLTISGRGRPGCREFLTRARILYSVAYGLKKAKKKMHEDFRLCRLEALFWMPEGEDLLEEPRELWNWKQLIRVPSTVTEMERLGSVMDRIERGLDPELANLVQREVIKEGLSVQMLHVGPYENTSQTVAVMNEYAHKQGLAFHGAYHEVYLSDPRRTTAEKLKTIIRIPVAKT